MQKRKVCKPIEHFEIEINNVKGAVLHVNRNAETLTKCANKDHNINAEVKDIVRCNTDTNKILPFTLTSPQLFTGHKEHFPSEVMSSECCAGTSCAFKR
jgi:hypothetical protein